MTTCCATTHFVPRLFEPGRQRLTTIKAFQDLWCNTHVQ